MSGFGIPVIVAVAGISAFAWMFANARREKKRAEGARPLLGVVPPEKKDEG